MSNEVPAAASGTARGLILVLSSPSGAGKTSIARAVLDTDDNIRLSISVTTRPRRASEVNGVHYHFVDSATFADMRDSGQLLEWAEVHGNLYGTPFAPVADALAQGRDILFDIDWQGTQQVRTKLPDDVVSVFVLPPSVPELKARLERRAQDAPDVIRRRLKGAKEEIAHWVEYEFAIVNRDLDESVHAVEQILAAERFVRGKAPENRAIDASIMDRVAPLRVTNQPDLSDFIGSLNRNLCPA